MEQYHVLFNPHAGSGRGEADTRLLAGLLPNDTLHYYNMTEIEDYAAFFEALPSADKVIVSGGDGTLNRFINDTDGIEIRSSIYYYATGSGNDFLHDLGKKKGEPPFCIDQYIKNLPVVTVQNKQYKFLNGIGYGIDGYCCEAGDLQREKSNKPVNYTSIAIKGLLFHYHPTSAAVTVDGVTHNFKKVWLAPTMNGRFYGGGMMTAPAQNRQNEEGTVSAVVMFGSGKLKTLAVFPSIFKGEHIKHTEMVQVFTGRRIHVAFDRPTALQIDGETVLGVTEYTVEAAPTAAVTAAAAKGA